MKSLIKQIHEDYLAKAYSCEEFVTQKIEKAKKNEKNSVISILEKDAIKQAKLVDAKIKKGEKIGLLEGIPFGVKDTFLVEGSKTTAAAKILEDYESPYTATVVQKLLDAGAILIVKENQDAFGHGSTTENSYFGPVKNALDSHLVAGGSSGGSAVNVANDITVFSIGEDTGGSIRQPAGYNHIVGLKPSYGAVSRFGCVAYASSLDTVGPLAKSVEDIALVMDVISGKDEKDMTTFDSPDLKKLSLKKGDLHGMKIGYYSSFFKNPALDKGMSKAFDTMFTTLKTKGAEIVELDFFNDELLIATYYIIAMAETASNLSRLDGIKYGYRKHSAKDLFSLYLDTRFEGFSEETKRRIILGNQVLSQGYMDKYYQKALFARQKLINHFQKDFEQVDMILSPITPHPVPKIGENLDNPLAMYLSDIYTVGFSLGKLPTISVPLATTTGVQISGNYQQDHKVLQFAHDFEILCS